MNERLTEWMNSLQRITRHVNFSLWLIKYIRMWEAGLLTEKPAQKGHECLTLGDVVRARAAKLTARIRLPSTIWETPRANMIRVLVRYSLSLDKLRDSDAGLREPVPPRGSAFNGIVTFTVRLASSNDWDRRGVVCPAATISTRESKRKASVVTLSTQQNVIIGSHCPMRWFCRNGPHQFRLHRCSPMRNCWILQATAEVRREVRKCTGPSVKYSSKQIHKVKILSQQWTQDALVVGGIFRRKPIPQSHGEKRIILVPFILVVPPLQDSNLRGWEMRVFRCSLKRNVNTTCKWIKFRSPISSISNDSIMRVVVLSMAPTGFTDGSKSTNAEVHRRPDTRFSSTVAPHTACWGSATHNACMAGGHCGLFYYDGAEGAGRSRLLIAAKSKR